MSKQDNMTGMDLSDDDIKIIAIRVIEYFESKGLAITQASEVPKTIKKLRYKNKKSLTLKEIAEAGLWGNLSKQGVNGVLKRALERGDMEEHEMFMVGNTRKIHRSAIERIGRNRGTM